MRTRRTRLTVPWEKHVKCLSCMYKLSAAEAAEQAKLDREMFGDFGYPKDVRDSKDLYEFYAWLESFADQN